MCKLLCTFVRQPHFTYFILHISFKIKFSLSSIEIISYTLSKNDSTNFQKPLLFYNYMDQEHFLVITLNKFIKIYALLSGNNKCKFFTSSEEVPVGPYNLRRNHLYLQQRSKILACNEHNLDLLF